MGESRNLKTGCPPLAGMTNTPQLAAGMLYLRDEASAGCCHPTSEAMLDHDGTTMNTLLKSAFDLFPFKKQAFLLLKHIYKPEQMLQERLNFDGPFSVEFPGGHFVMQNYEGHDHVIENEIFWKGLTDGWEKNSLSLWIRLCASAQTIVDIGSNTGIYSLVAKAVKRAAHVIAFEPVRPIYDQFQLNMQLNGFDVRCVNAAVSDTDGTGTIFDIRSGHTYTASMDPTFAPDTVGTPVRTMKLSTYLRSEELSSVDLMRIDVEKHEYEVLVGIEEFLGADSPSILIEILTDEVGLKIEKMLEVKRYRYYAIDEKRAPRRSTTLRGNPGHNYLLCSADTANVLGLEN